ncbi:MAG: murein hydrolase activator EnvC [Ilumatobacter sp.]
MLGPSSVAFATPCWRQPTVGTVSDPFREPLCPYCAGNRGIEYRTAPGRSVRSVAAGVVSWTGVIAGVRWVVIRHVDGWRATYGHLAESKLQSGDRVPARSIVGATSASFYFGLRRGDRYVDPAKYLGRLVGRSRLIPVDGATARPAPPPRLSCAAPGVAVAPFR